MLFASILLLLSFICLLWSASKLIDSSVAIAKHYNVSPLLIGLTIVALGTSLPEVTVSLFAVLNNNPDLAIGNAIGSNIANIGLVLGMAAVIAPLSVTSQLLRREFPLLLAITVISLLLLIDGDLDRFDGIVLMLGLVGLITWLIYSGLKDNTSDPLTVEYTTELARPGLAYRQAIIVLVLSIILLGISSRTTVWSAVQLAQGLGVSPFIIGVTVIAVGTSLPELVAAIIAALKHEHDIAIGNIVGSNMFNLLAVMGLPAILSSTPINTQLITRDLLVMTLLTIVLLVVAYGIRKPGKITRIEGGVLLSIFLGYFALIILSI